MASLQTALTSEPPQTHCLGPGPGAQCSQTVAWAATSNKVHPRCHTPVSRESPAGGIGARSGTLGSSSGSATGHRVGSSVIRMGLNPDLGSHKAGFLWLRLPMFRVTTKSVSHSLISTDSSPVEKGGEGSTGGSESQITARPLCARTMCGLGEQWGGCSLCHLWPCGKVCLELLDLLFRQKPEFVIFILSLL